MTIEYSFVDTDLQRNSYQIFNCKSPCRKDLMVVQDFVGDGRN